MFHNIVYFRFAQVVESHKQIAITVGLGVMIFAFVMVGLIAAVVPLFMFGFVMLTFAWWSHRRSVSVLISNVSYGFNFKIGKAQPKMKFTQHASATDWNACRQWQF